MSAPKYPKLRRPFAAEAYTLEEILPFRDVGSCWHFNAFFRHREGRGIVAIGQQAAHKGPKKAARQFASAWAMDERAKAKAKALENI